MVDPPKPLVLIVDDTADLREALSMVVEFEGFEVISAAHGGEGIRLVLERRPAVVLLDMNMPEVDGLQFLERLPLEVRPPLPVVVAMSADESYYRLSTARGAAAFIEKPMSPDFLMSVIKSASAQEPMDPNLRILHLERRRRRFLRDDERRDAVLDSSRIDEPEFHRMLSNLLRWLAEYFEAPMTLFNLLRHNRLQVFETCGFPGEPRAGTVTGCDISYCCFLIRANESIVLNDTLLNPFYRNHPATKMWTRFYASVPVTTPEGLALATLCLENFEPTDFFAEDARALSAFASALGRGIAESSGGTAVGWAFFPHPVLLDPETFRLLFHARLERNRRTGQGLDWVRLENLGPASEKSISTAFGALAKRGGVALAASMDRRSCAGFGPGPLIKQFVEQLAREDPSVTVIVSHLPLSLSDADLAHMTHGLIS